MQIDPKTLRRHYRQEIDHETEKVCALVASNMVQIAMRKTGGMETVAAGKFVLACRGHWRAAAPAMLET